jgi:hypothetical protein
VQRLQRDSQRWNHPSQFRTDDDINDTAWLQLVKTNANQWIRPPESKLEPNASPAFDKNGLDIPSTDPPLRIKTTRSTARTSASAPCTRTC